MVNKALVPSIKKGYQEYKKRAVRSSGKNLLHYTYPIVEGVSLAYWEQNPNTSTKWAKLANKHHDVVQVLYGSQWVGIFVDDELTLYP